ncbi:hypothetical protein NLU13_0105 [Sarocladium strictum]|uniref:5'-3' DNA helicase ZGRF1-like N-terminal domain-containing protein n=1 Tax=Sarocladium strictum TaxID=5046 RepID=A0AA39LAI5_SARSR|nr:hypothetical protein NLU13_0105 [Sarocladium strictum]
MSSRVETTGTSATVHDFICLFTHDFKRKQKRWQDGKLKYHTFNKKLMVYDDRGNFIGESHWQGEGELEDGCELTLERGGAIVQVAECVGSRTQDLTELVEKRAKEVELRRASKTARTGLDAVSTPCNSRIVPGAHAHHLHQRPLSTLIRTPGPIGRAVVPSISPYESRIAERSVYTVSQGIASSSKRKRSPSPPSKMGHARALFGTQLSLSAAPSSLPQVRGGRPSQKPTNILLATSGTTVMNDGLQGSSDSLKLSHGTEPRIPGRSSPEAPIELHPAPRHPEEQQVVYGYQPTLEETEAITERTSLVEEQANSPQPKTHTSGVSHLMYPASDDEPRYASRRQPSPSLSNYDERKRLRAGTGKEDLTVRNHATDHEHDGFADTVHLTKETPSVLMVSAQPLSGGYHADPAEVRPPAVLKAMPKKLDSHGGEVSLRKRSTEGASRADVKATADEGVLPLPSSSMGHARTDEPRTELRIRSRQRRGLLMLSEKESQGSSRADENIAACRPGSKRPSHTSQKGKGASSSKSNPSATHNTPELPQSDHGPGHATKGSKKVGVSGSHIEEQDRRFEEWLGADGTRSDDGAANFEGRDPVESSRTVSSRSKTKTRNHSDEQWSNNERAAINEGKSVEDVVIKGPRLSRLARKSIKSKEIIGFVPAESAGFHMPFGNPGLAGMLFLAPKRAQDDENGFTEEQRTPPRETTESLIRRQSPMSEEVVTIRDSTAIEPAHSGKGTVEMLEATCGLENGQNRIEKIGYTNDAGTATAASPSQLDASQHVLEDHEQVVAQLDTRLELNDMEPSTKRDVSTLSRPRQSLTDREAINDEYIGGSLGIKRSLAQGTARTTNNGSAKDCASRVITDGDLAPTEDHVLPQQPLNPVSTQGLHIAKPTYETDSGGLRERNTTAQLDTNRTSTTGNSSMDTNGANASRPCRCASSASSDHSNSSEKGASNVPKSSPAGGTRQISNPATRGRKAAAKKDAAGMAPRTLVQLDPPRPVILRRGPAPVAKPPLRVQNSVVASFTTANGGAWSKHAQDLLGMTHPGRARAE